MGKSKLANAICCPILLRSYLIFYSIFLLSRALLHISALGECVFAFVFLCLPNELSIDCQIIKQKRSVGKASRRGSMCPLKMKTVCFVANNTLQQYADRIQGEGLVSNRTTSATKLCETLYNTHRRQNVFEGSTIEISDWINSRFLTHDISHCVLQIIGGATPHNGRHRVKH